MQKLFLSILIIFFSLGAIYYIGVRGTYKNDLQIGDNKFWVQMVDTNAGRQKGLSDRYGMCSKCGMVFIFDDEGERGFWMKDMRFDLDMLFLNSDKQIVKIYQNVDRTKFPEVYSAVAKYVVELKSGVVDKTRIKEGDVVNW